jgi:hypothetical protein
VVVDEHAESVGEVPPLGQGPQGGNRPHGGMVAITPRCDFEVVDGDVPTTGCCDTSFTLAIEGR